MPVFLNSGAEWVKLLAHVPTACLNEGTANCKQVRMVHLLGNLDLAEPRRRASLAGELILLENQDRAF